MLKPLLKKYSQVFPIGDAREGEVPQIFKRRRKMLLNNIDSFALFSGVPREPGAENVWIMNGLRIFQEPAVMYLTGINQPEVLLALNPLGKEKEVLFIPEKNPAKEFWDGVRLGYTPGKSKISQDVRDIQTLTGIECIYPLKEFESYFDQLVQKSRQNFGYAFYHQYPGEKRHLTTDHNWSFYTHIKKRTSKIRKNFLIKPIAKTHLDLRLPLDDLQIRNVAKATSITNRAFKTILPQLKSFKNENDLGTAIEYEMKRRSIYGLSFPSIIASGENAATLHYLKNDAPMNKGQMVLLDFGARYGTMHADISRTIPLSGRFNPMQKILYQIVLDALKENQKNARAGITIATLNKKVWSFIEKKLEERFLSLGGKAMRPYKGQPHGVSHLMGEQEHDGDPFSLYKDTPMKEGWQISNEPGLYGRFSITLRGKKYNETLGIRIEDNLLIQKDGCLNFSKDIPAEIEDLENFIASL